MSNPLICPKCKEPIPATLKSFKVVGCLACGNISTLNKDGHLHSINSFSTLSVKKQEPFILGKQIQYQQITYNVVAIFTYEVKFEEWDTENSTWLKGKGVITEWYAYNDQQQLLIVMRDSDEKFYAMPRPLSVRPTQPMNKKKAKEHGQYQLSGFVGVDDEALEEKGHYRIYGSSRYECADENFEKTPMFQYQLTKLSPTQVKRMVILEEMEKLKATKDFANTTYYRNMFAFALLAIVALLVFNANMNEGKVQRGQQVSFGETYINGELDTLNVKPQYAGSFYLVADQNYRLTAMCDLSGTNQYMDYSMTIVRQKDALLVGDAALSFYTESGTDDEGDWEENLLQDRVKFQVEKTGKYEIFVAPDYENLWQLPKASLAIQIEPTSYTVLYFCMSGFFLLLWLIFQWRWENLIALANLPRDTILHEIYESLYETD